MKSLAGETPTFTSKSPTTASPGPRAWHSEFPASIADPLSRRCPMAGSSVTSCENEISFSEDFGETWQKIDPPAWNLGFAFSWPAVYATKTNELGVMAVAPNLKLRFGALAPPKVWPNPFTEISTAARHQLDALRHQLRLQQRSLPAQPDQHLRQGAHRRQFLDRRHAGSRRSDQLPPTAMPACSSAPPIQTTPGRMLFSATTLDWDRAGGAAGNDELLLE